MFARRSPRRNDTGARAEKPAARAAGQQPVNPTYMSWMLQPVTLQRERVGNRRAGASSTKTCSTGACAEPASLDAGPANVGGGGEHGQPLPGTVRELMEPRFGHHFSDVRVHAGDDAARSAQSLSALAYTAGRDVVFGAGQYTPDTVAGRRLLAHELAHVVQQSGQRAGAQAMPGTSAPGDAGEREADVAAGTVMRGERAPSLGGVTASLQRACGPALGAPAQPCTPSSAGLIGWQFMFGATCDDLLPGEEANVTRFRAGSKLKVHGFAHSEGTPAFMADLACHRANRISALIAARRPECSVVSTFKHVGPTPAPSNIGTPTAFWQTVIVEEIRPDANLGTAWLDPNSVIADTRALYDRARAGLSPGDLDQVAARRPQIRTWLDQIAQTAAPESAGLDVTRQGLTSYRHLYDQAERLWQSIDMLLAQQNHAQAANDTYTTWASGTGTHHQAGFHATNVPQGARYHIDLFGEGHYAGAVNIGMATRTTTTGVSGSRVPNVIYRRFSGSQANHIPIADHVADLVTEENGPIGFPGLAAEIARILAPGGSVVLTNPDSQRSAHDAVARAIVGGRVTQTVANGTVETRIDAPAPTP